MLTTLAFLGTISVSILLSFLPQGRIRAPLIVVWWLTPLWIAIWLTIKNPADIDFEFGTWAALLVFTPIFLAAWSALTVFLYKIVLRIREINSGV